jgi:nitroreductase
MVKEIVKRVLGPKFSEVLRKFLNPPKKLARPYFEYDQARILKFSGIFSNESREKELAKIIATYHVVEKGLTMPNRRFVFGVAILRDLMKLINSFVSRYGKDEPQVIHAIGVIKAYYELHLNNGIENVDGDPDFFSKINEFLDKWPMVPAANQIHTNSESYFSARMSSFPEFSASRKTLRHYSDKDLPIERIRSAVQLALNTPSACNRQHCKVYCITQQDKINQVLEIQKGSRGFGHLANKLVVVTSNLEDVLWIGERNDAFVNGGLFLMNLCYALHWEKVAHCILNWSRTPAEDMALRKLIPLKDSETVIALLTCGEVPDEFEIASSPRKNIDNVFEVI